MYYEVTHFLFFLPQLMHFVEVFVIYLSLLQLQLMLTLSLTPCLNDCQSKIEA